jgi:hypothetical protein
MATVTSSSRTLAALAGKTMPRTPAVKAIQAPTRPVPVSKVMQKTWTIRKKPTRRRAATAVATD